MFVGLSGRGGAEDGPDCRGADIAWLSVFPDEKETLYPPLTYLRPVTMGKEDVGGKQMLVSTVEPQFPS